MPSKSCIRIYICIINEIDPQVKQKFKDIVNLCKFNPLLKDLKNIVPESKIKDYNNIVKII